MNVKNGEIDYRWCNKFIQKRSYFRILQKNSNKR